MCGPSSFCVTDIVALIVPDKSISSVDVDVKPFVAGIACVVLLENADIDSPVFFVDVASAELGWAEDDVRVDDVNSESIAEKSLNVVMPDCDDDIDSRCDDAAVDGSDIESVAVVLLSAKLVTCDTSFVVDINGPDSDVDDDLILVPCNALLLYSVDTEGEYNSTEEEIDSVPPEPFAASIVVAGCDDRTLE